MSSALSFTTTMEGTSMVQDIGGSISSRSDSSEFDPIPKLHASTPHNFPSRRSFMSKPIHPVSFPFQPPTLEPSPTSTPVFPYYHTSTSQRDITHRWSSSSSSSSSSSIDINEIPEPHEPEFHDRASDTSEPFKCGLCDRLLTQRSHWSSRRIVKTRDMPIAGVLSCKHVFHAECLERMTPKSHKSDPLCPLCTKMDRENSTDQQHFIPGLRNSMFLLNRNRIKKGLSLKDNNSSNDISGKSKKSGSYPLNLFSGKWNDCGIGGCSKSIAGPSAMK